MGLGALLDSAAGHEHLLTQISNHLDQSYAEMSRLRDEWADGLHIDRAQLIENLREFHKDPSMNPAVGYVAQLNCDLVQFQQRYQAALSGSEARLWDAVIVTDANARITALKMRALGSITQGRDDPAH